MARPRKQGLGYFPFDCDFFSDEKIVAIAGEFGLKGEIITIKLLCAVYRNGYFAEWGELMKFKLLKELPGVSVEMLDAVVSRLVRWGFFDEELFSSVGVLTSEEIQRTYFGITRGRMQTEGLPYLMGFLHRNPAARGVSDEKKSFCVRNSSETGVSYEETGVSYKKTPQIKGNYIKKPTNVGKESAALPPPPPPPENFSYENSALPESESVPATENAVLSPKSRAESDKKVVAVTITGREEKSRENALNEDSRKKALPTSDYRKPVHELTAICKSESGYLDSVMRTLQREDIHRSREAVLAELDNFPNHLQNYGKDQPRRLQDFKAHFMNYLRKKWTAATDTGGKTATVYAKPDYGKIESEI